MPEIQDRWLTLRYEFRPERIRVYLNDRLLAEQPGPGLLAAGMRRLALARTCTGLGPWCATCPEIPAVSSRYPSDASSTRPP